MTRYNYYVENPPGGGSPASGAPFIVPVVFHLISNTTTPTYTQIKWQLARINAAFQNQMNLFNGQTNGPRSVNTQIEFRLACVAQNCGVGFTSTTEPGVMRYTTSNSTILNQGALTASTYTPMLAITHPTTCPTTFPFVNYLNIWCVPSIGGGNVIGYGTFPWMGLAIDGIVMDIDAIGNNSYPTNFPMISQIDKGSILAHEVGHYLGLYHTFETMIFGCSTSTVSGSAGCYGTTPANGNCDGDRVLDTPPTSIAADLGSISLINTCHETNFPYGGTQADHNDQLENYMSYSDDDKLNTFTQGQANRMISTFTTSTAGNRNYLNNPTNLIATGVYTNSCSNLSGLLTPMFNYSIAAGSACTTANVQFINPSSLGFTTAGTTYNWNFGDATSGTGLNPIHTYTTPPSTFTVTLSVTNGTTTLTYTRSITLPTGQASIVNQGAAGIKVCKGSEQTIFVRFQNNVPSAQITDGTTIYTVYNNFFPWNSPSQNATQDVPFTVTLNNVGTVVFSMVPAVCSGTNLGSATFTVSECCNTLVNNGDFEAGNTGFYTDHCMPANNSTASMGTAGVNFENVVFNGGSIGCVPSGKILGIDGCVNAINPNCASVTTNTVPNSCSNAGIKKILFGQTLSGLLPNTNYYVSFKSTQSVSASVSGCGLLNLGIRLQNGSTVLLNQNNLLPSYINDPYSPNNKLGYWHTFTFNITTPSTITTSTTFSLEVYQMDYFGVSAFDYAIDNIALRALTPGIQALGTATLCPAQSTTLSAVANCGLSLSNYTYAWAPNVGLSSNTIMNPTATPSATTEYTLVATPTSTVGGNPTVISTVLITVKPTFTVAPMSQFVYAGQSATITAGGSTGTYTWMPGSLTGSVVVVTPTATTVYTVTNAMSGTCSVISPTVTVSAACSQTANLSYGTSSTSTVTFPSGTYTVSGTIIDMQGLITFTASTSFTGYTLRMAPGTTLNVAGSTSTLTLDNCKLFSCTELWYGITLFTDETRYGSLDVKNGTTIEDMYAGIIRKTANTYTTSLQGFIKITDSKLNKNYIGVQLLNIPGVTPAGVSYSLTVKNSTITTVSSITSPGNSLKPSTIPTYTYAYNQIAGGAGGTTTSYTSFPRAHIGINLYNLNPVNNVVIGDSAGASNTYNTFSNLDLGIVATNAQLRVHNNYFYNLKGSPKYAYFDPFNPITVNGPDEIGVAIVASHTVANTYSLQVGTKTTAPVIASLAYPKSNAFKTLYKGISAKNCMAVIVKGNYFEADTTDEPFTDYMLPGPSSNTYRYYKAQVAMWITALSKNATLSFNFIKNYRTGIFSSHTMSVSTGAVISCKSNNIQVPHALGYCRQAIQFEQVGGANIAANGLEVSLNNMNKVYGGITCKAIPAGVYVHDNNNLQLDNIKTIGKGLTLNYPHFGIYMFNVQNARIEKNGNVNGLNTLTSSNYSLTTAFYLQNSPSCTVTCNSTNNTGRGFSYVGNNTSPNGFLGNAMSNCYNGYELRTNGVIGAQGSSPGGTLAANTWSNVTQETYVLNSPTSNTVSYMYVAANVGAIKTAPTLNIGTAGQTYSVGPFDGIRIVTGTPFSCGGGGCGGCDEGLMAGGIGDEESTNTENSMLVYRALVSHNTTNYELFPDEFVFHNQQYVYRLQKEGVVNNSASDTVLNNFYNLNQASNIDRFVDVADAVAEGQIASALTSNNTISPANPVQEKTQRINDLMLKVNSDPNYVYSATEVKDLIDIVNECSVKGWYVIQARNILNVVSGQILFYNDDCEESNPASRIANKEEAVVKMLKQPEFTLYPNPNKGVMTLIFDMAENSDGKMQILDVTGKLVNEYSLQGSTGTLNISEENLHNGIYFYSILVNEKIIKTDKIVVIK